MRTMGDLTRSEIIDIYKRRIKPRILYNLKSSRTYCVCSIDDIVRCIGRERWVDKSIDMSDIIMDKLLDSFFAKVSNKRNPTKSIFKPITEDFGVMYIDIVYNAIKSKELIMDNTYSDIYIIESLLKWCDDYNYHIIPEKEKAFMNSYVDKLKIKLRDKTYWEMV